MHPNTRKSGAYWGTPQCAPGSNRRRRFAVNLLPDVNKATQSLESRSSTYQLRRGSVLLQVPFDPEHGSLSPKCVKVSRLVEISAGLSSIFSRPILWHAYCSCLLVPDASRGVLSLRRVALAKGERALRSHAKVCRRRGRVGQICGSNIWNLAARERGNLDRDYGFKYPVQPTSVSALEKNWRNEYETLVFDSYAVGTAYWHLRRAAGPNRAHAYEPRHDSDGPLGTD